LAIVHSLALPVDLSERVPAAGGPRTTV